MIGYDLSTTMLPHVSQPSKFVAINAGTALLAALIGKSYVTVVEVIGCNIISYSLKNRFLGRSPEDLA